MGVPEIGSRSRKWSLILLTGYFLFVIPINWISQYFFKPPWPDWFHILLNISIYLIISLLIWVERHNLSENNIDKCSIFIFLIFGSILRPIYTANIFLKGITYITFLLISGSLFLALRRTKIELSNSRNLIFGIFLGSIWIIGEIVLWFVSSASPEKIPWFQVKWLPSFVLLFFHYLSSNSISEEPVFRGLLWGVLRRSNFTNKHIILIQATLFTIGHINLYLAKPISYYIGFLGGLFIFSLFQGFIAWKSQSIVPCYLIHAFHNTMGNFK
jgi:membrane protease YdiL (CAAX protease family)